MRRFTGWRWALAILAATVVGWTIDPPLLPLLIGVLGLLRGRVWGLILLLVGSAALLLGAARGDAQPGALIAGAAGLISFLLGLPLLWRHDRSATAAASFLGLALGAVLSGAPSAGLSPRLLWQLPPEPVIAGDAEPLFSPSVAPRLLEICTPRRRSEHQLYRRQVVYDFADEQLQPLGFGPRVAERPRTGYPRGARELEDAVARRRGWLRDCYRWARSRRADLAGQVAVELRCSELGTCAVLSAVPEPAEGSALGRCVREVLEGLEPVSFSFTPTRARLLLRFAASGQVPDRLPARPLPPGPAIAPSAGVCFKVPRGASEDRLLPDPIVAIDDFDQAQAERDARRELERRLEAWRRGGRRGPRPALPPRVMSSRCSVVAIWPDKEQIRRTFGYNLGRYRACYREALARRPGLAGRVTLSAVIDPGGGVTARLAASTAQDPALEECLRRALEEVWFAPSGNRTTVASYPFLLDPARPATQPALDRGRPSEIEARAAWQLALGDGGAALRSYSALLRQLPGDPRSCRWRSGALESVILIAPWGWEDARVRGAAKELIGALASRADRTCLARSLPALSGLATRLHRDGNRSREHGLLRLADAAYRVILDRLGSFPRETYLLRYFRAEVLYRLDRFPEAAALYHQVALMGGKYARDAAYAEVISLKNALDVDADEGSETTRRCPRGASSPLEDRERKLLAAYDLYLKLVPDAPERAVLFYSRARVFARHCLVDQALPVLERLVRDHPDHDLSAPAARLLGELRRVRPR